MEYRKVIFVFTFFFITAGILDANDDLIAIIYGQSIYRSNISFSQEEINNWRKIKTEKEIKEILDEVERLKLSELIFDRACSVILGNDSCEVTDQEIQSFLKANPESEEIKNLNRNKTTAQNKSWEEFLRKDAHKWVRSWKTNKRLYEKYGGRIVYQQVGLEPIDAYQKFIKEIINSGKVEIISPEFKSILTPKPIGENNRYMNEKDAKNAFAEPWWVKKK